VPDASRPSPVPPLAFKQILELYGFKVISEDEFNWLLADPHQPDSEPLILPKIGELVAIDIMMQAMIDAKMGYATYFALRDKVIPKAAMLQPGQPRIPKQIN
jgi:hypothetical protein